jgi:hypothetical protein
VGVLLRIVFLKRIASFRYFKKSELKNCLVYVFEKNQNQIIDWFGYFKNLKELSGFMREPAIV